MKVIASGTFDRLHEGHKHFLKSAFNFGYVYLGLTSDSMIKNKPYAETIQSYSTRKEILVQYLLLEGKEINHDYQILEINDKYGFAVDSMDADAIIVTSDTIDSAEEINDARAEYGIYPLEIIEIDLILKEDKKISSRDIRKKEND